MLKLETTDSSDQAKETLDSSSKFQDQYVQTNLSGDSGKSDKSAGKVLKVADAGPGAEAPEAEATEKEESAEQQTQGDDPINALLKADPESLSKNMRSLQGLVENFAKADDRPKALEQYRGAIDKNIKQNDDDFQALNEKWKTEAPLLKPKFEAEAKRIGETQEVLNKVASTIPEAEQPRMKEIVHLWSRGDKNSPELKSALEKELGQTPGLLKAVKDSYAANTQAPTVEKVQEMQTAIAQAAEDRVASRMIYAELLAAGGDEPAAKRMMMQGMAIQMDVPLEQVEELMKRQQPKDK